MAGRINRVSRVGDRTNRLAGGGAKLPVVFTGAEIQVIDPQAVVLSFNQLIASAGAAGSYSVSTSDVTPIAVTGVSPSGNMVRVDLDRVVASTETVTVTAAADAVTAVNGMKWAGGTNLPVTNNAP